MDCPRCHCQISEQQESCADCDFSLSSLSARLGTHEVSIERLTDAAHCLRLREAQQIEAWLNGFQCRFPQVHFVVFLSVIPARLNARELSFWLLNRASLKNQDQRKLNRFAILLAVDPVAKTAALTVGYALEKILPPHRLAQILQGIRASLWHGEYVEAIRECVAAVEKRLRKGASCVRRSEEISPPESDELFLPESCLHFLKNQHSSKSMMNENDDD